LLKRRCADIDPGAPTCQRALEGLVIANTAGQLDVQPQVRGDLGDDLGIVSASEGSIQVDQMDPLGPCILPPLSRCPRITEPLLRAGAALDQLHSLAACDVDRRQQYEPVGTRRSR